jgi:hypothetical protein
LKEFPADAGQVGGSEWRAYGGHRLWHAPEHAVRTYEPDNEPVQWEWDDRTLSIAAPPEPRTGIRKEIALTLHPAAASVTIVHRLVNTGLWDVRLAPWALTVMAPGGRAVVAQEPYAPHPEALLAARPLVLWPYTDMADPRLRWGRRTVEMRQDAAASHPLKFGVLATRPAAAYEWQGMIFLKRAEFTAGAVYPDFNCNLEFFTNAEMLEVESLGPLTTLAAGGGMAVHTERWYLFHGTLGASDQEMAETLESLLREADRIDAS